jgi:hypothetical protein
VKILKTLIVRATLAALVLLKALPILGIAILLENSRCQSGRILA